MKRRLLLSVVATIAVLLAAALMAEFFGGTSSQAANGFTDSSITGTYGFVGDVWFTKLGDGGPFPHVPHKKGALVGLFTFDGSGGCTQLGILNGGHGAMGPISSTSCFYGVDSVGTGWIAFETPLLEPARQLSFVIVDGGNEIFSLDGNPGVTGYGVLKRQ